MNAQFLITTHFEDGSLTSNGVKLKSSEHFYIYKVQIKVWNKQFEMEFHD